ncbi:MAG: hypothetical protein A2381_12495 [Bdellovibrionales bacterium RIFOXYB1_FULL_37_110]|nr:MAG: hypothetical protein A2181_07220 [Bdellovibrionales bacterium RIFOXYA1_FULL_38_20]OFZ51504.1 MAG: hypothetical protein A2417_12180 [Bdellovibrionales bacterium RIFOXYC1_FULL_37_79]OFZ60338.1 MAG: hypothetical protein A2381_12495 [Bdellovibrionales bacterium RIFOXYB1_FULL_37_110]OFZ63828.1 MAG: hypothetical protein A2577_05410 [Bdellovibrionales bacterium RIFOXYD1_FULL_36_51]
MNCSKCKFFYITWDSFAKYGCKAYKFKSKEMPCLSVKKISNQECQLFKDKAQQAKKSDELDLTRDDLW